MKAEDGKASARAEDVGDAAEKGFQHGKFLVDVDADGLKAASLTEVFFLRGQALGQVGKDDLAELFGGLNRGFSGGGKDAGCKVGGKGFVSKVAEDVGEFLLMGCFQPGCGALAALWVHSHVQGAIGFEAEAACGVIDLHGGKTEVCEDEVRSVIPVGLVDGFGEGGVAAVEAVEGECVVAEFRGKGLLQALGGLWQLDGVLVDPEELPAGEDEGDEAGGVAAVAEGCVQQKVPGLWAEALDDFLHHDGEVLTGGCFAAGDQFLDKIRVLRGCEFLVFLMEQTRIFSAVALAPLRRWIR